MNVWCEQIMEMHRVQNQISMSVTARCIHVDY